jgi:hypothetical protein
MFTGLSPTTYYYRKSKIVADSEGKSFKTIALDDVRFDYRVISVYGALP